MATQVLKEILIAADPGFEMDVSKPSLAGRRFDPQEMTRRCLVTKVFNSINGRGCLLSSMWRAIGFEPYLGETFKDLQSGIVYSASDMRSATDKLAFELFGFADFTGLVIRDFDSDENHSRVLIYNAQLDMGNKPSLERLSGYGLVQRFIGECLTRHVWIEKKRPVVLTEEQKLSAAKQAITEAFADSHTTHACTADMCLVEA